MTYNLVEINKNLQLVRNSTNDCLLKLKEDGVNTEKRLLLEERLEITFLLADAITQNLKERFPNDPYISRVIDEINELNDRYKKFREDSEKEAA